MHYKAIAPPDELRAFVKFFWILESNCSDGSANTFNAVVDGCPGIVIADTEKAAFCNENNKKLPYIFLYGQTTKPVSFTTAGTLSMIGACLQPNALKSIFGFDAREFIRYSVDINLLDQGSKDLSEQLYHAVSRQDKIKLLSSYIIRCYEKNRHKQDGDISYALALIEQSKGSISIDRLQQELRISGRSLERKFQQNIGISPKYFSRICRFQETLAQMRSGAYDKLSDIAYQSEYADQSHFIRVFKEFTGVSPLAFRKQAAADTAQPTTPSVE